MPGRSDKIREGEPGITVDGVPLEQIIEAEERKERQNDLEDTRREEIGTKIKGKKRVKPRERYEDDPRKVHKRVRRLSEYEIRKEYGVKHKPFPSLSQNVLFVLFQAGDQMIGSRAIADETGKSLPDVSSCLSTIYKRLRADKAIYREKLGLAYQYRIEREDRQMGFDALYLKYFPGVAGRKQPVSVTLERSGPFQNIGMPYKKGSHNIVHFICLSMSKKFTTAELAAGIGKPTANVSSTVQKIVNRLSPLDMVTLSGPMSRRVYQLHPGLKNVETDHMLDFLFSHHKHWDQGKEKAWVFWNDRISKDPVIPAPPDPAEKATVTAENATNLLPPVSQRIEALEQDGLAQQIEGIDNQLQRFVNEYQDQREVSGTAPTNEFTINVRFLFGRA